MDSSRRAKAAIAFLRVFVWLAPQRRPRSRQIAIQASDRMAQNRGEERPWNHRSSRILGDYIARNAGERRCAFVFNHQELRSALQKTRPLAERTHQVHRFR